jgi:serine/threonine-protein kinase
VNDVPSGRAAVPLLLLGAVWLVALVAAGASALAAVDYVRVEDARTPSLTGLPLAEASRRAEEAGLSLRSYPVEAAGVAAQVVVEQAPPAGAVVRSGRTVAVGVQVPSEADRMPALVGVAEEDALAALAGLALPAPAVRYAAHEAAPGRVVAQQPPPGRSVPPDAAVELVVSRGPDAPPVEVPRLVGSDLATAREQLAALGVRRVEAVPVGVSMERPGTVTQQRPAPGTVVPAGTPVLLGYALEGSRVAYVPDVAGFAPWRARVALRSAGLAIGPVETVRRDDLPAGVVATRPSGLTVSGAPVTLVVNRAGDDAPRRGDAVGDGGGERPDLVVGDGARTVPFRFDPADLGVRSLTEQAYRLRLVVRDDEGERTVLDRTVPAGQEVRATVLVRGEAPLLQTYVNGVFFQAWRP